MKIGELNQHCGNCRVIERRKAKTKGEIEKMRTELNGGRYVLKSDQFCVWAEEVKTAKNGNEYERRVSGYYGTVSELVDGMMRQKILLSEATTLAELKSDVENIRRELLDFVESISRDFRRVRRGSGRSPEKGEKPRTKRSAGAKGQDKTETEAAQK
jgi:hypothetical protein